MTVAKNHNEKVMSHLTRHGDITPMEAWNVYGCYRLSSVINRLRKKGHAIGTRMKTDDSGKQYAQYFMVRNAYLQTSIATSHEDTPMQMSLLPGDTVKTTSDSPMKGRLARVTKVDDHNEFPIEVHNPDAVINCPLSLEEVT